MESREHEVARERGLNSDIGGFAVANLADHDNIGILTHNRAETLGKGVLLSRNLCLYNTVEMILNGIFNSDYFYFWCMNLAEKRVKRCCFTASGWASGE